MVAQVLGEIDVQKMIGDIVVEDDTVVEDVTDLEDDTVAEDDSVVEDDAVDYSHQCYIQVYEMFADNDVQKADNVLQEKSGDKLEQQGVDDEQKDDGMIHNTVEEVELDGSNYHLQKFDQDKQEDPQMRMSSHNVFDDEQQQAIDQNQQKQENG